MTKTNFNKVLSVIICFIILVVIMIPQGNITVNAVTSADLSISDNGISFICAREGFHATCYSDYSQSSIGYGTKCTGSSVQPHASGSHTITKEAAMAALKTQINSTYAPRVRAQTSGIIMNQSQFDALVSLCYNCGGGSTLIANSPLVRFLKGELTESQARTQYSSYIVTAGGKVLQGLINRRNAEADLFFSEPVHYDPEGYLDTAEGGYGTVTLTGWALDRDTPNEACEIHIYMDGPSGQGGTCIATGIMADQASPDVASIIGVGGNHRFNVTLNLNVTGNHSFYAYAINRGGGDNNPQLNGSFSTYIYEKTNSVISNVYISSMTPSGYTVNIAVNDESKVGRIAVPVWTEYDGQKDSDAQDDLHPNWQWESIAKKNGANTYAFYVNTKDHNNECGRYCNDVYAYDESGKQIDRWCLETNHRTYADVPADKVITKVSPTMITHSGYKLNITVADDSRIDKIAVPVWTTNVAVDVSAYESGQDDLLTGWQGRCIAKKTAKNHYEFDVSILDHNGEHGEYNNDIYAYDEEGNLIDRWCLETNLRTYVDVPAEKVIEDVIIENETPYGYDVIIKVVDESVIKNVSVPVWSTKSGQTDSEAQDDLIPDWESKCVAKKISTNTYSYHVNISDHKNETGEYCNDIYIYGNSGALIERWSIETSHRTYAYVPKNIMGDINSDEIFNISDVVLLQKWLLAVPDIHLANWKAADLSEDGRLDVFDLCLMKRMLVENS